MAVKCFRSWHIPDFNWIKKFFRVHKYATRSPWYFYLIFPLENVWFNIELRRIKLLITISFEQGCVHVWDPQCLILKWNSSVVILKDLGKKDRATDSSKFSNVIFWFHESLQISVCLFVWLQLHMLLYLLLRGNLTSGLITHLLTWPIFRPQIHNMWRQCKVGTASETCKDPV